MIHVLDSSAMLALLRDEPGADVVEGILAEEGNIHCAHVLNLCEVFYDFRRTSGEEAAQRELKYVFDAGVLPREDLDAAFWQDAGRIKADYRRVSLADCCGLALTRRLGGTFLSTDHHELDTIKAAGLCDIDFVR